jgi:hypothetical protein
VPDAQPTRVVLSYAGPLPPNRPEFSLAVIDRNEGGGIRVTDPPRGWKHGVADWVLSSVMGVLLIWVPTATHRNADAGPTKWSPVVLLALTFLGLGVFGFLRGLRKARGWTILTALPGCLTVEVKGAGRPRRIQIANITDVRATIPSPGIVPTQMFCDLVVVGRNGLVVVLRSRRWTEVNWLVSELRQAVGLPAIP